MNQITPIVLRTEDALGPRAPVYQALDLTDGGSTAHILLDDKVYQLRITKLGKLILTK